jgi:hypothetical protein
MSLDICLELRAFWVVKSRAPIVFWAAKKKGYGTVSRPASDWLSKHHLFSCHRSTPGQQHALLL